MFELMERDEVIIERGRFFLKFMKYFTIKFKILAIKPIDTNKFLLYNFINIKNHIKGEII